MGTRSRAYAPGHVTGVFRPATRSRDPRSRGSVGAGLVLELGATADATWYPGARRRLDVHGVSGEPLPITADAVSRLLSRRRGHLTVTVHHSLPVGQGFGMSAAGTLAASLATASLFDIERERAIQAAHLADLFGLGGLGGVTSILGGGMELRRSPGVPPFGDVVHRPWRGGRIFLVRVGPPIPSSEILASLRWRARIETASRGLDCLLAAPSEEGFLTMAERFTDRLQLGPASFRDAIRSLRHTGCWAAQAMFGNTVLAVPRLPVDRTRLIRWLQKGKVSAVETDVGRTGARLLPSCRVGGQARPQRL